MDKIKVNIQIKDNITTIWDAWTKEEHIKEWYSVSEDWWVPRVVQDFKVNGAFTYRMEAKDGSFGFDYKGIFNNIVKHKQIDYVLEDGRKVETIFEVDNKGVSITQFFDPDLENDHELQKQGWQFILEHFKTYVEDKGDES